MLVLSVKRITFVIQGQRNRNKKLKPIKMTNETNKQETTFGNYRVETSEGDRNGRQVFFGRGYRATPKGKYSKEVREFGHYWITAEQRAAYLETFKANIERRKADKDQRVSEKKEARKNMENPFKVGEIYYDSWGYEQTNIDFYQIIEVLPRSVKIRPIGGEFVDGSYGHDSAKVKPTADDFQGESQTKPVQVMVSHDGKISHYIKSRHGWISKYNAGESGVQSSWGY